MMLFMQEDRVWNDASEDSGAGQEITMASVKRVAQTTMAGTAAGLRPLPLCDRDLRIVQTMLSEVAPEWSVELHGICSDEATLVVLPEDGEDALGPSFAITRESYGLRLDQIHWDELTELGVYPSLNDVIDVMGRILSDRVDFALPASVTIH
jgi:hypothetical protein